MSATDLRQTLLCETQGWERNNFSAKWCRDMRLDTRGMSFAREVRRQLTDLVKRADFLPYRELAPDRKSSKRKRDTEGEPVPYCMAHTNMVPVVSKPTCAAPSVGLAVTMWYCIPTCLLSALHAWPVDTPAGSTLAACMALWELVTAECQLVGNSLRPVALPGLPSVIMQSNHSPRSI